MNREEYYKLYGVKVNNKTSLEELEENEEILHNKVGFDFSCGELNYFGNDFTRDLKRNIHLFRKEHE